MARNRIKMNVLPSKDLGKWFVRVTAGNGKTVFSGETLNNKKSAVKAANRYAPPGADVVVHDQLGKVVDRYAAGNPQ